jgi:hypothetical protein
MQGVDVAETQQRTRDLLATLHVREKIGAAGQGHRVWAFAVQNASRFIKRARRAKCE